MPEITINRKKIIAQAGTTVLQTATEAGIYIPTLCYHPRVGKSGNCRVCVIEVEGMRGLQLACMLEVKDGMVIHTESETVNAARKVVVGLLLADGNFDLSNPDENELAKVAQYCGLKKSPYPILERDHSLDDSHPMLVYDESRCIRCFRCIRACNTNVVNEVLDMAYRGLDSKVVADANVPWDTSSCVACGECIQICPTGALIEKQHHRKRHQNRIEKVDTVCPYCGVGCKITLHIDRKLNKIVRVSGVEGAATNDGMLCVKGRFGYDFVNSSERLTSPLIRDTNGSFQPASWEKAFSLIAKKFTAIKETHGSDSIAGLSSAKCTNEENFLFQKFMRKEIGTNNVDHCARLCHASTIAGLAASLGSGAMTNDIAGIQEADVILVIGSDTTAAHPVIAARIKQAVRFGKTKLIVIDPKKIRLADYATIYACQRCGSDVALLNGIMHLIIKNGWEDSDYINTRCEGFDALKAETGKYTPAYVARVSGIPVKTLKEIAQLFGTAETAAVFFAMGITQHTTGTDNVWSIANLQMLCGNLGKAGGGVNPLRGQSNVQGACDMGCLPNVYPAYQEVTLATARNTFEKTWQTSLSCNIGLTVTEMIDGACNGTVKALYVMGENPALSDPDQHHVEAAFKNLDFMVVQDIFLTETARFADVVLPSACFAEKNGTITNTERRVQRIHKALKSPGHAKEDWEIIQGIAHAMGSDQHYKTAEEIAKEISLLAPSYGGITWERLKKTDGLQWPCPTTDHPGTPILYREKFTRGLGLMKAIASKKPAETPDRTYPFTLTTGRVLEQFHTGTMTRKTAGLNELAGPMVMMNTDDAKRLRIRNRKKVRIETRRGTIEAPAFVTGNIGKGTIYIPFHYVEAPANRLTNPAIDPVAKIPEYKVCAARIRLI